MEKKKIQARFPHYKLSDQEIEVVDHFERNTMYEVIYTEDAIDTKTFIEVMERNYTWIEDHISDICRRNSQKLNKIKGYEKAVYG